MEMLAEIFFDVVNWFSSERVSAIGTLLQGTFSAATFGAVVWGFRNWRRERRGTTKFQLASEALEAMDEARDIIQYARASYKEIPFDQVEEFEKQGINKDDALKKAVYTQRFTQLQGRPEFFAKFNGLRRKVKYILMMIMLRCLRQS